MDIHRIDNGIVKSIMRRPIPEVDGEYKTVIALDENFTRLHSSEETLKKIAARNEIQGGSNFQYFAVVLDPVFGKNNLETSIPVKDMLGILLTEGMISEQEMLDAYKSLDLGKDNKFLNQQGSPTRGSWASSLF